MEGERRCQQTKADGSPCQARPLPNSDFCAFHDPDVARRQQEGRRRGGRQRSRKAAVLPEGTPDAILKTPADVRDLLARTANQTLRGEVDVKVANAVCYLLATLLRSIEGDEMARRVEALEQAIQTRGTRS
jgi:hypothetical protein